MSQHHPNETNPEFDFLHHLRTTLILLGCRMDVANLLQKSQDMAITRNDVDRVMNYNCELIAGVKGRLSNLPTFKLRTGTSDEEEK